MAEISSHTHSTLSDDHWNMSTSEPIRFSSPADSKSVNPLVDDVTVHVDEDHGDASRRPSETDPHNDQMTPRFWSGEFSSLYMLCLFGAASLVLDCVAVLPRKYPNVVLDAYGRLGQKIVLSVLLMWSMKRFVSLMRRRHELHEKGYILWPHRCAHCAMTLKRIHTCGKLKPTDNGTPNMSPNSFEGFDVNSNINTQTTLKATHNSTFYVTCLFTTVLASLYIVKIIAVVACVSSTSGRSQGDADSTPLKTAMRSVLSIAELMVTIFLGFFFIPIFHDAYFISSSELRRTILLFTGVSIWFVTTDMASPLDVLKNGHINTTYYCTLDSRIGHFVEGVIHVTHPFDVESPIMVCWMFIELWSRFLPRYLSSLTQSMNKHFSPSSLKRHLRLQNLFSLLYALKSLPVKTMSHKDTVPSTIRYSTTYGSVSFPATHPHNGRHSLNDLSQDETANGVSFPSESSLHTNGTRSLQTVKHLWSNSIEPVLGISVMIGAFYFGISNYVISRTATGADDGGYRGRYIQWTFRIAFFFPVLLLILKQRRMTRHRADSSYTITRGDEQSSEYEVLNTSANEKLLILTAVVSCSYEFTCFVAAVCNLINYQTGVSRELIALNVVSILSSVFSCVRKSYETVFLLCVQRQHFNSRRELSLTLYGLLYVGVANVTQWLWESFIHDFSSPLAWPVLTMFFDGKVGQVVGIMTTPFVHLYELHTAILAFEIFAMVRRSST